LGRLSLTVDINRDLSILGMITGNGYSYQENIDISLYKEV